MVKRRGFSDQFKAAVALEALRCDKTVQEIAAIRACRSIGWSGLIVLKNTDFGKKRSKVVS